MIPITAASFAPNGFGVIGIFVPRLRISSFFHNKNHRYSYLKGKTPLQRIQEEGFIPILPPPRFQLPDLDYIPEGTISLVRFIRSDRKLDILEKTLKLPKNLCIAMSGRKS